MSESSDYQREIMAKVRKRNSLIVREFQERCLDCGQTYDPVQMVLFPLEGTNVGAVRTILNMSEERVYELLEGCDPLCRNCAALRRKGK